ncbi:MAG TPA: DUF11 domain-containing protein [Pyrinomonadaceae bacterium]|nr:DUF11 domain-containing protein [Pyrinomonadaceae bacterium]
MRRALLRASHSSGRVLTRAATATRTLALSARTRAWQFVVALFALAAFASTASAQVNIYQLRGLSDYGIYVYNVPANTNTQVYDTYPVPAPGSTNSATLAQRPSDGMLFYATYVQNVNNQQVYRFNPATPNIAPVPLTGTMGASVPSSLRMSFSPSGTLYYLPDTRILYTINQTTGVATSTGITVGAAISSGGDMAFNSAGTLYVITSAKTLYTVSLVDGTATQVGDEAVNFTDLSAANQPDATLGLAFDSTGRLLTQTRNPNRIYVIPLPVGATATPQANFVRNGDGDITSTGDMASANVPAPNLSITKTDNVTTVYRGGPVTYTIVVTNSSAYPVTGTVTDSVPATVTGVTWNCVASAGSTCNTASGSGNNISTTATLAVNGTATYTVSGTISATATGTISNQATVQPPSWLVDSNATNNTATDTSNVNLNANLGITKTDNATNVTPGATVTYSVVVSNAGPDTATGALVTDTVPAALTGVSWTCGALVNGATCGAASGSGNTINTTATLPDDSSVTYTITGTLSNTATGTLTNSARVLTPATGVTDPNDPTRTGANNNTATDNTTINTVPNLAITKTHSGNFTVGTNGTYTLTASNSGNGPTSGTITVVDNLPAGLTVAAIPVIPNWNCGTTVVGSSTLTCTSTTVILAGTNHSNAITLDVVVGAAAFAASPVTNVANISGGGEPAFNNGNNSASDPTTINGAPDLSITKTHTGNFTRGSTTDSYTITVTNSGTAATTGATVTVTDTLPAGLTPTAPTGLVNGWTCNINLQVVTCTRANALAVGQSYPVINVTVTVSQTAANSVTNSVTVSGGGEPASLNGNNTATDPTTIISRADLSLTKTANNSAPLINQLVTFTLTVTNAGPTNTTGVTVRDLLPAGLSFVSATPAAAYNNTTGVWTIGNLNSGSNSTLQIVARVTTSGAITNTAQVTASAVTDPDSTPNNNVAAEDDQASVLLGVPVPPDVRLQKRCTAPVNCESAAQQPGTELTYTITFTNTAGTSAAQGLTIVDIIPITDTGSALIRNTEFKVGSMTFSPGTSGLSILPTDYRYYNDPLVVYPLLPPWTPAAAYTPTGTFDYNVTYIAWKLTGSMPPGTSGSVTFTVRIR